jgi:hypothetical protein
MQPAAFISLKPHRLPPDDEIYIIYCEFGIMKMWLNFWMYRAAEPHDTSKNSCYPKFTLI